MKASYRILPKAQEDLHAIVDYIAERNPAQALRIFDALHEAIRKLARFPRMGHGREDLTGRPLRFWTVHSYVIIYRADRTPVQILRVVHGARDVRSILEQ